MMDKIDEVLERGVEEILPGREGLVALMKKNKIRLYLGIDPTGGRLHLGHTISLRKIQQFADLGHEAILVIGTGTVLAGDPSARNEGRTPVTEKEIKKNISSWRKQAGKILDLGKVKIKYNGDWLLKLNLKDILKIASQISAIQLFKRDMFQRRIENGDTVWLHETLYPLLQGYDSVVLDVDLEVGGKDQTFNMLIGRELQRKMSNREKYVLTTEMILGTDGQPMSKTSENCVWLTDSPGEMFGKIMSIPDEQIIPYFTLLTDVTEEEITEMEELLKGHSENPMVLKKKLAREIVTMYHSDKEAQEAEEEFEKVVQKKELPTEIKVVNLSKTFISGATITDVVVETELANSRSEAKRLISQGGTTIAGEIITDPNAPFTGESGTVIRVGKRKFVKINIVD